MSALGQMILKHAEATRLDTDRTKRFLCLLNEDFASFFPGGFAKWDVVERAVQWPRLSS